MLRQRGEQPYQEEKRLSSVRTDFQGNPSEGVQQHLRELAHLKYLASECTLLLEGEAPLLAGARSGSRSKRTTPKAVS